MVNDMTLTFSEARDAAKAYVADGRNDGDLVVAAEGWQDVSAYLLSFGHWAWIQDGDTNFMDIGPGPLLVDKHTGEVRMVMMLEEMERVEAMEPASVNA